MNFHFLRPIFHIFRKELLEIQRDNILKLAIIIPLLQTTMFGFLQTTYGGGYALMICDEDNSRLSRQLMNTFQNSRSFFLAYLASEFGWVVAEVGRQPWAIQDMLPVKMAATHISVGHVQATFIMFFVLFAVLLLAEIKIMLKQIKIGPEGV